jgi:hypothetical protein
MDSLSPPTTDAARPQSEQKLKSPPFTPVESEYVQAEPLILSKSSYKSNENLMQEQPSIAELDQAQRLRREASERLTAELHSSSVLEKLKSAQESLRTMQYAHNDSTFRSPPVPLNQSLDGIEEEVDPHNFHHPFMNFSESLNHPNGARPKRPITATSKREPPRLRIRPFRSSLEQERDEEMAPKIIRDAEDEKEAGEQFRELFRSPDSNKFVLQNPNAPLQELTFDDSVESYDHYNTLDSQEQAKLKDRNSDKEQEQSNLQQEDLVGNSQETSMPVNSPDRYSLHSLSSKEDESAPGSQDRSSSDASAYRSPIPIERKHSRKKIMLKPKKRSQGLGRKVSVDAYSEEHSISTSGSVSSDSSSNFDECSGKQRLVTSMLPFPPIPIPESMDETRSLNQMTSELNTSRSQGQERKRSGKNPSFLSLRPKSLEVAPGKVPGACTNDIGDAVMDLDSDFSLLNVNASHLRQNGVDADSRRFPSPTVAFKNTSVSEKQIKGRSPSFNIVQNQIGMAREAAARFGDLGDSFHSAKTPYRLTESDFRTPNPSSAPKIKTSSSREEEKKKMTGIFLPKFEDDSPMSGSLSNLDFKEGSNSFIEMMKGPASPISQGITKSPKS